MQKIITKLILLGVISMILGILYLSINNTPNKAKKDIIESTGDFNDITIAISSTDIMLYDSLVYNVINTLLDEKTSISLTKENIYNINWKIINKKNDFTNSSYSRNFILISIIDEKDSTADNLVTRINNKNKNYAPFTLYKNLYSNNQLFFILKYKNNDDFLSNVNTNIEWIKEEINLSIENNILNDIKKTNNAEIEMIIENLYNIQMNIDKKYIFIDSLLNKDNNFLWIGNGNTLTNLENFEWLILFNSKINNINDTASVKNILSTKLENYINRSFYNENNKTSDTLNIEVLNNIMHIDDYYDTIRNYMIIDGHINYAYKQFDLIESEMESYNSTGGPFKSIIFKEDENNYIFATGFINDPTNNSKYKKLKRIEINFKDIKRKENK